MGAVAETDQFPGYVTIAAEISEDFEMLADYFGLLAAGRCEPIDVKTWLLEKYSGGMATFELVDSVFRACGWKWPNECGQ